MKKEIPNENDLHMHLKKIHKCDLTIEQIKSINREITIGDLCNWNENNLN